MTDSIVIMGVAGCGKSSLGAQLASSIGKPFVEGDLYHCASSLEKMRSGVALTDDDRADWLGRLCDELAQSSHGLVMTCSALKRSYRERLRAASPGLRFVFLSISPSESQQRVAARSGSHFFSTKLIDSQFATLEVPSNEARVLSCDATQPVDVLMQEVLDWLSESSVNPNHIFKQEMETKQ